MNEKIRKYLEHLFENAPVSKKAIELKEELYANSVERFLDLTEGGMAEEDAYKLVINSIGDIKTLLASIEIEEEKELCREYNQLFIASMVYYVGTVYCGRSD